ncbi:MOSC domain-containing protein [Halopiger goleimassiliensis]|uniref:MOSC domain-containing protein n=1 Tax=Halopiger goleimassiliensis TaxID=1293048 RepID=UPI0006778958|nr:MOSC N-terminal beta barrel domain-containing protein [Halopiger goleimassiliensis]
MARIERIRVYPVKGFDGIDLESASILEGGTLAHDREFALFDSEGEVVNGKRTARIHEFETDFDPETTTLSVVAPDGGERRFDLDDADDRDRAATWLGDHLGVENPSLERDRTLGYVDRREMGPSVISTASLEAVASWFDDLTVESARRRLRANVEVSGVPAFWEDRFVGDDAPTFAADGITFEGVTPCGRCVVPQRDPDTGEPIPEFQQRFVEKREETFPEWADPSAFDHYYTLMLISRIPEGDRGARLSVGDPVTVSE